ncbi:hypothetical protein PCURB6_39890 [Paenibacillus curdlanolyticus]|nr:hypothetical protein PCURB6_39890 [Paenibacillus curdlanolyticus]
MPCREPEETGLSNPRKQYTDNAKPDPKHNELRSAIETERNLDERCIAHERNINAPSPALALIVVYSKQRQTI